MRRALAFGASLLLACSSGGGDGLEAGADGEAGLDAGPPVVEVAASQGTWQVADDVTFTGKGATELGAIAITHGVGTIDFHGETAQAFYAFGTPTPTGTGDGGAFANERDFEIVAASPDRVVLVWITCAQTDLAYVYYESTDGIATTTELAATGTCTVASLPVNETVSLPALSFPPPALVSGFTVSGADVSFDGTSPGSATFANATWAMYPFHQIDCSTCATPGWFELHTLFWQPGSATIGLGILYLEQSQPNLAPLAYFVRLPTVDDPIGQRLDLPATWTTP